ncbi:MAG: hypothetical protein RIF36_11410 [Imperialibacter sp.]|uniref:hypothetical protein n=1 Tax=Imperialibacter sp. TaxID=2038411 RepID=UPI0032EE85B3
MTKPGIIKWITGLIIFRLVFLFLLVGIAAYVLLANPEAGFLTGFASTVIDRIAIDDTYSNPEYMLGSIMGYYSIMLIPIALQYVFLILRKGIGFWIAITFDILVMFGTNGLPFISFLILGLSLSKDARKYLSRRPIVN